MGLYAPTADMLGGRLVSRGIFLGTGRYAQNDPAGHGVKRETLKLGGLPVD